MNMVFNVSEAISQVDMILTFATLKLNSPNIYSTENGRKSWARNYVI